ncbi:MULTISPECIES: DUF805 domain-containing protein [Acinetobacter]|uniref:Uncharacterized membrane protein YhaH, DUF805 family n=1 Tax=Acinetobacter kyonggiensis TaxID=595670 RepID=A0A1H3JG67_9GAMM|nr:MULTISPECIES: DUF805 domain-containing protein [Acinetobacter]OTG99908.1 DUF805 domain-containing protein [Acinetobacter sp. ANC 4973]SDY38515.1 Uncharacterized membrane protein YhaH, DUF805 family [Acinetobacter kyonggiensis]
MNNTVNDSVLNAAGRFSRFSYLGWNGLLLLVMMLLGIIVAIALPSSAPDTNQDMPVFAMIILGILYIALIYFSFIFAVRRLHDRNHSGWLSLLMLVPLVNIGMALYLTFAKGDAYANQFGLPRVTRTWEKVLGWIYVLIFPIGILAAIAIPAYQDYVQRAHQGQIEIQQKAE